MTNFIITVVLTWLAKRPTHVPAWLAKLFLAHMLKKKGCNTEAKNNGQMSRVRCADRGAW
jgi:hypothetical protein